MSARLDQAFRLAAGELGMASAAWLFAGQTGIIEGPPGVALLRDELGRSWPLLDAVCAGWRSGLREPVPDASPVLQALQGVNRLVVVGNEALWLDALVSALPASTQVAMLQQGLFPADWSRVLGNYAGRVQPLTLGDFQRWGGSRSALLTFVYGDESAGRVFVMPDWSRVVGTDVRTQFRALVGWHILPFSMPVYPRWLVPVEAEAFTHRVPEAGT